MSKCREYLHVQSAEILWSKQTMQRCSPVKRNELHLFPPRAGEGGMQWKKLMKHNRNILFLHIQIERKRQCNLLSNVSRTNRPNTLNIFKFKFLLLYLPLSIVLKATSPPSRPNSKKIHPNELDVREKNGSPFSSPEINVSTALNKSVSQSNYLVSKMVKFSNLLSLHAERDKKLNISLLQGSVCSSWWSQTKELDVSNSSLQVLSMWELKTPRDRVGEVQTMYKPLCLPVKAISQLKPSHLWQYGSYSVL